MRADACENSENLYANINFENTYHISIRKELADLRVKKATRQEFKPHVFKQKRLNLAQLLTIKSQNEIKQLTK